MNSMGKLMNMNIFIKYITLYLGTITASGLLPVAVISGFRSFKHSKFSSEVTVNGKLGVPPIPLALLFNTYTRDRRTATRSSFSQSRTLIPGRFEYSGRLEIFSNAPITPKYFFCLFNSNRISDLSANIIKTFVQAR